MSLEDFAPEQRGSAVRWFAYAAAALTIVAAVGAHGMAWLASNERGPLTAFLPLDDPSVAARAFDGADMMPTGSVRPPASGRN